MNYLKLFIITLAVLFITDWIWLGLVAKKLYVQSYQYWFNMNNGTLYTNKWAVALVYILFALGIVIFIPPVAQGSILSAAIFGGIFGAIIYGIYDFTCLALFKNWPIAMSLLDWAWGAVLGAWASAIAVYWSR